MFTFKFKKNYALQLKKSDRRESAESIEGIEEIRSEICSEINTKRMEARFN